MPRNIGPAPDRVTLSAFLALDHTTNKYGTYSRHRGIPLILHMSKILTDLMGHDNYDRAFLPGQQAYHDHGNAKDGYGLSYSGDEVPVQDPWM